MGSLVDVNVDIVADTGDEHGVLKPNELESACARPYNLWNYGEEENIVVLAVSILSGIVQNHPFIDGNKRTALVAARALLINNGYDISIPDRDLGPLILEFAAGHLEEADIIEAFEEHLIDA
ncbi:type II toxin-antitoxin system death-on-curing family toxin [Altererythrobacter salegens]|uniref:Type II toxin-antitoxin system death-on-curing family toxin n=1 Tax=Croceibacterium salegens TaxID=1737568 RepID=A0A6I4SQC3_9SPHN|nr:type II toxin-antitoxin system death-on-curing family toxin [Croceibacterium salegens]MXO58131.1 type II toxin-antitoxin system death-on-curing family toxin [Croceibacterium salegens]